MNMAIQKLLLGQKTMDEEPQSGLVELAVELWNEIEAQPWALEHFYRREAGLYRCVAPIEAGWHSIFCIPWICILLVTLDFPKLDHHSNVIG